MNCVTALLYDISCASWPVLPAPQGDHLVIQCFWNFSCHVGNSKQLHIHTFFFFFLNIKLTICCTVNLITTCLSPLTATRECLIYNTPLCLHFPPLGYSHTVGSWHGYHIAQMVTSCAVRIQNLVVSLLHEGWEISRIVKYTNRHPQLPDIDHVSSATNKILQEIVRNISGWKYPRSNTHSL